MEVKPPCPICTVQPGKNGRPKDRVRPEIRLSTAYVSRIGADCGEMFEMVERASAQAVNPLTARELSLVAEKLAQMQRLFQ